MAFTRDELAAYEKGPQKKVDDKLNPFRGATPARQATGADVAAAGALAAEGEPSRIIDATGGETPAATGANADLVVDEDGTLGDPTDSGEGTSTDENTTAESSAAAVDSGDEADPNTDLTGEQTTEEEVAAPAPKKGSAQERIVEALDLAEGYKVFGKHMQEQLLAANAELARIRGGGTTAPPAPAAVAPPVEKDEPMPDMADDDVAFDNDKYREKMAKWVKTQGRIEARRALQEEGAVVTATRVRNDVETKCAAFAKDHADFETVVTKNPVLAQNQLAPDAGYAVAQSEYTADLLYAFGQDPALAIRVARMNPAQQLLQVGKMIAQIEVSKATSKGKKVAPVQVPNAPQAGAKPVAKKSITQAPPPPRATQAAGRATTKDTLDPTMDMNEFARQHRAGKQTARSTNRKMRGLAD